MSESAIRNIVQTHQEREIIKTAPDMVVYLDGLPFLPNKYLDVSQAQNQPIILNFNDHVTTISGSYDVENFIPTCNISLSVPNDQKYLYMAPGGNHIIDTMMEVQVFSKGYHLSTAGNSIYRRMFKGLVSHAGYNDNGKTLEISIQCVGVMKFLELMQVDLNPATQTNSPWLQTTLTSQQGNMNPLLMIMDMMLRSLSTEGFQINSFDQQLIADSPFKDAVNAGYVAKWQTILDSIKGDVHLYGATFKDAGNIVLEQNGAPVGIDALTKTKATGAKNSENPKFKSGTVMPQESEAAQLNRILVDAIQKWTPDLTTGGPLALINGRIMSRLERLRYLVALIGYEGYQDIDGSIIMKPPLWNLDVVNLGTNQNNSSVTASTDIYSENNPFIVALSEIESEQETEDQNAIRATRMTVFGPWQPGYQLEGNNDLRYVSDFMDIRLMSQFGLREEPAKNMGFAPQTDKLFAFGVCVNELVKANRAYRTYTCRIPLRPELKLGFPVFFPHRDMYGYLRAVSYNYNVGGSATMDLVMDQVRRRPVFPNKHKNPDGTEVIVLTSQPNLVSKWTKVTAPTTNPTTGTGSTTTATPDSNAVLTGKPMTMPRTKDLDPSDDQAKILNYRRTILGSSWRVESDTGTNAWRVQADSTTDERGNTGVFTKQRACDGVYMDYIRHTQPYTDDKGYELIGPFPWGRWESLKDAIQEFTRNGYIVPKDAPDPLTLSSVQAFLFAGVGGPSGTLDASSKLTAAFNTLKASVNGTPTNASLFGGFSTGDHSVFELTYPTDGSQNNDQQLLNNGTPDAQNAATVKADVNQRVQVFVTGPSPTGNADALKLTTQQPGPGSVTSALNNVGAALKGIGK